MTASDPTRADLLACIGTLQQIRDAATAVHVAAELRAMDAASLAGEALSALAERYPLATTDPAASALDDARALRDGTNDVPAGMLARRHGEHWRRAVEIAGEEPANGFVGAPSCCSPWAGLR